MDYSLVDIMILDKFIVLFNKSNLSSKTVSNISILDSDSGSSIYKYLIYINKWSISIDRYVTILHKLYLSIRYIIFLVSRFDLYK